jgi:3-oxoacyl-[acyl-carrier protein] reductase
MATPKSKRTAFVTGGSYGVGAATALALARDGFEVAVSATRADHLKATLAKLEAAGANAAAGARLARRSEYRAGDG